MKVQRLGEIEIHKFAEIDRLALDKNFLFGNATAEIVAAERHWLGDNLVEPGSDRLYVSFHTYVIRTPRLNILVDTCNGNDKERPSMPAWHRLSTDYLDRLARLGLAPEDIHVVMCTHLHADHVGWNTRLEDGRWVPTFPNARYVMSRGDYEVFDRMHRDGKAPNRGSYADSVLPVVEHGLAEFVDPAAGLSGDLARDVAIEAAPGHSPDNMNIHVRGGGRHACLCGDVLHHAIQCADPTLGSPADHDPAQAYRSRLALLETHADTDTLILTGHFPTPTAGRIVRHGRAFRFRFEPE